MPKTPHMVGPRWDAGAREPCHGSHGSASLLTERRGFVRSAGLRARFRSGRIEPRHGSGFRCLPAYTGGGLRTLRHSKTRMKSRYAPDVVPLVVVMSAFEQA